MSFFSHLIFTLLSTKLAGGHVEIQQCEYQSCSKSHKYVHPFRSIYTPCYNTVGLNTKQKKEICTKWLYKNTHHQNTHLTFPILRGATIFCCFPVSSLVLISQLRLEDATSSKESAILSSAIRSNSWDRGEKGSLYKKILNFRVTCPLNNTVWSDMSENESPNKSRAFWDVCVDVCTQPFGEWI